MNMFIKMNCMEVMKAIKRKKDRVGESVNMSSKAHLRSPINITNRLDIEVARVPN